MNKPQTGILRYIGINQESLCPGLQYIRKKIEGFWDTADAPMMIKGLWLSSTNKKRGAGSKSPFFF